MVFHHYRSCINDTLGCVSLGPLQDLSGSTTVFMKRHYMHNNVQHSASRVEESYYKHIRWIQDAEFGIFEVIAGNLQQFVGICAGRQISKISVLILT